MKQLLLSTALFVFFGLNASAQCIPDPQFTLPGVYPDSATGLSIAYANQPYIETLTIVVPLDTTIMIGPIPFTLAFDSVLVTDWQGLPPGFTYSCYDAGNTTSPVDQCAFEGNTAGCVSITGNPTTNDIGSYQQIITTQTYSTPDSPLGEPTETIVDYYYIQVMEDNAGVTTLTTSKFLVYPNPAKESVTINGLNDIDLSLISVLDLNGKIHATYTEVNSGALNVDLRHLQNGMYFVKIDYNGISETLKFVKE